MFVYVVDQIEDNSGVIERRCTSWAEADCFIDEQPDAGRFIAVAGTKRRKVGDEIGF